jgi:hypothetical protein
MRFIYNGEYLVPLTEAKDFAVWVPMDQYLVSLDEHLYWIMGVSKHYGVTEPDLSTLNILKIALGLK